MLRTFAVLLLLLGLATATPVVCLCAPDGVVGLVTQPETAPGYGDRALDSQPGAAAATGASDAPGLIASSAAAAVSSQVATAAGVPSAAPWQLTQLTGTRLLPPAATVSSEQVWSPALPPPRAA